jgi:hypothetical protein
VHELTRAEPGVEVVWRAFELRPDPVPPLDSGGEYLRRAWNDSVYPGPLVGDRFPARYFGGHRGQPLYKIYWNNYSIILSL